jgi:hypothetical protein
MENQMSKNLSAGAVSLKVLAERKIEGVQKQTQFRVNPLLLVLEDGYNIRPINRDHVESIKQAYMSGATLPPILVIVRPEDGALLVRDGFHRTTALQELIAEGEEILLTDVSQFRGNDADCVALMVTSQSGLGATPLQLGYAYLRLEKNGWSNKQIADRVGKSVPHIAQCLALTMTNSDVQKMIVDGTVKAHTALKAVRQHKGRAGEVLASNLETALLAGKSKVTAKSTQGATPKDLIAAIETDRESGGSFKAEDICPFYAPLILYLRNSGKMSIIADEMSSIDKIG